MENRDGYPLPPDIVEELQRMGTNGRNHADVGDLAGRIQGIAYAWDSLDSCIAGLGQTDGLRVKGIKCINKGASWLVIVQARFEDAHVVCFREASSSGDIGKVIRGILESPEWKPDKFALDKVK